MRIESITRDKRRCMTDAFNQDALRLLPGPQHALLCQWLKSKTQERRWDTLIRIATDYGGNAQIEVAESLAEALVQCGAAILEQRRAHSMWENSALIWRDYEALNSALGLATSASKRAEFDLAWKAAGDIPWQHPALADAYRLLPTKPADQGTSRLTLLRKLNEWLAEGRAGTRYQFSLFSFGQTKHAISPSEWEWLEECIGLAECGIEQHAPALWLAGDLQLQIGARWMDIGAACDAVALTPATLKRVDVARSPATHYRLVENRTSFEHLAKNTVANPDEIIVWLPGYAPTWWLATMGKLLNLRPAPARVSCDADPDGVQIAMRAATLWTAHGLAWQPHAMDAAIAAEARHKLRMNEHDIQLAQRLLNNDDVPVTLVELLRWCLQNGHKAEQEN